MSKREVQSVDHPGRFPRTAGRLTVLSLTRPACSTSWNRAGSIRWLHPLYHNQAAVHLHRRLGIVTLLKQLHDPALCIGEVDLVGRSELLVGGA